MPKPNSTFTLIEIRSYVRSHRLNKPEIRLGMKKAELIAGLKKHGHWDHKADARISLRKGGAKPPMVKKKKTQPKKEAPKPKFKYDRSKQPKTTPSAVKVTHKVPKATKKIAKPKSKKTLKPLTKINESEDVFEVRHNGTLYQVDKDDGVVISHDDFGEVGTWNEKTGRIDFDKDKSYVERAKDVFESHKRHFGHDHYALVEISGYGSVNWDGYNLYERELFGRGKKIGTYQNEKNLQEWKDYGRAQAFTKYDPLELKRKAKGLKLK